MCFHGEIRKMPILHELTRALFSTEQKLWEFTVVFFVSLKLSVMIRFLF